MSTRTMSPVLLIGGSGHVGARAARALRRLHPELPIAIGGRDGRKAAAVAAEVGGPTTAVTVDVQRSDLGLEPGASFSAIVTLVKDESSNALKRAQADGVPYIAFSDFVSEIGPLVAHYVARPTRAPILMLGHTFGGAATLAALHLAQELRSVDAIAIAAVIGADDHGGPASSADYERLRQAGEAALVLDDGKWTWLRGEASTRRVVDAGGAAHVGQALPLPDVVSLAAATDARSIRVDLAARDRAAGAAGPRTELIVEVSGRRHDGSGARLRYDITDADNLSRLSAYGAAIATERLLGLAGGPPVGPGLYNPESVLDPASVVARLEELGARVRRTLA
ncbi:MULTISPECIES: hypothetical protein [Sorangium]|uniref:Saccharopine dehydrogenase n=1 Tax=Sorangium cellulosum TaxID=56 RepID=A0A4P2QME3_SORCE|nr:MULTISPECIES: hypothetical protein [Sorangium]AUX31244.1 saccharopine dehydrogenase [Sorangium cellulosum]WCQ90628.1 hypothetical protein NQZ70_03339 [Sorangium sp. Soce836]